MIYINLLPHREETRKKKKETFLSHVLLSAILGGLLVALGYAAMSLAVEKQEAVNSSLTAGIKNFDKDIAEITEARKQLDELKAKREAVENLQTDRNMVVRWMEDLVRLTPEGIYLTEVKQKGLILTLEGMAIGYDNISQLISNTAKGNKQTITNSTWKGSIVKTPFRVNKGMPAQTVDKFSNFEADLVREVSAVTEKNDPVQVESKPAQEEKEVEQKQ